MSTALHRAALTPSGRRSAEERAAARTLGVDRLGRPTARALGINPKALRAAEPELSARAAARRSAALLERHHADLASGRAAGHSPDTWAFPGRADRVKARSADPAGVDSGGAVGHGATTPA